MPRGWVSGYRVGSSLYWAGGLVPDVFCAVRGTPWGSSVGLPACGALAGVEFGELGVFDAV